MFLKKNIINIQLTGFVLKTHIERVEYGYNTHLSFYFSFVDDFKSKGFL